MRFIFNFIFFGILFYLIYLFFPEAFQVLVSWADSAYQFFRDLFILIYQKVQNLRHETVHPAPSTLQSWLLLFV